MPTCCAPGCTRTNLSDPECTFFSLPWKNSARIRLWISRLKLVHQPARNARICHYHFQEKFITVHPKYKIAPHLYPRKRYTLTPDAFPSIFDLSKAREASLKRRNTKKRMRLSNKVKFSHYILYLPDKSNFILLSSRYSQKHDAFTSRVFYLQYLYVPEPDGEPGLNNEIGCKWRYYG